MKVRGVVKGKTIVLDDVAGLSEGQGVEVEIRAKDRDRPDKNLAVFERLEDRMGLEQYRKWAVIQDAKLAGTYDTLEEAQEAATRLFGSEPCLIRQFGAHPRVYYRPTTYTPVPREFSEQIEVTLVNADD